MEQDYPKELVYRINIDNVAINQYNNFLKVKNIVSELPIPSEGYLSFEIYDSYENMSDIMKDKNSEIYHKFMITNKSTFVKTNAKYMGSYPLIINLQ